MIIFRCWLFMPKFVNFLHRVLVAVYRNKTNGRMNEHSCTRLMAMRVLNMAERQPPAGLRVNVDVESRVM